MRSVSQIAFSKDTVFCLSFFLFYFFFEDLFIYERHKERGRDIGRGRVRLPRGTRWSPNSIPGPRPEPKTDTQLWSHPVAPFVCLLKPKAGHAAFECSAGLPLIASLLDPHLSQTKSKKYGKTNHCWIVKV